MRLYIIQELNRGDAQMKFKGSIFEERCNEYWNKKVVGLDNIIRTVSLGFGLFHNETHIPSLIEKYHRCIQNILSALDNQTHMFEDIGYVQKYKKDTVTQAIEDLNFYAGIFPEHARISETFIETLSASLDTAEKINQTTPSMPF
ncbi:hypothetical protein [Legionella sainthelensi]|uniref:hypothetical protein n=1 Tax=Legionella sainthelensi TaxID=28087 RepID=UPI0021653E07|nr:hypothetical protein [Legionella sainthelensi]